MLDPGDLHRPLDILMKGTRRLSRRGDVPKKAEQAQLTTNLNHPVTQWLHEFSVACHPEAQRLSCST